VALTFSIITVALNAASTIAETIESVLAQEWPDVEHIIIDGASTDRTAEIIGNYASRHPDRIRWDSRPDAGIYDAMNRGIRMATGKVVGILNADDFYHRTDALTIVARQFISNPDIQGIYADVRMVHPEHTGHVVRHYRSRCFRPWMFRFGMMPAHPTFFTYRTTFEKYGLYRTDLPIAADFEMLLRLIGVKRIPVRHIPVDLLTMRTGGISDAGLATKIEINRQDLLALRLHDIRSCHPLLWLRYPVKLLQYL